MPDTLQQYPPLQVRVGQSAPPEDLLALYAGSCGKWQICVFFFSFFAVLLGAVDLHLTRTETMFSFNYTCAAENSTQCEYSNGTLCEDFNFFDERDSSEMQITTFSTKYNLVCDKEFLRSWVDICFQIGMIFGYFFVGWSCDCWGQKITAMIAIPFQCTLGIFLISVNRIYTMLTLIVILGMCSTYIWLLPRIAVCETFGNKFRTVMLCLVLIPNAFSPSLVRLLFYAVVDINKIIAIVSTLPLILLVPLLFFRNSPSNITVDGNFHNLEETIRKIAHFNGHPFPNGIKIRPVNITNHQHRTKNLLSVCWKNRHIRRTCFALILQWYFDGYGFYFTMNYLHFSAFNSYIYGAVVFFGLITAAVLSQFVRHRLLLAVVSLLKYGSILGTYIFAEYSKNEPMVLAFALVFSYLYFLTYAILDGLSVRMYPTEARARALAFNYSTRGIGMFSSFLYSYYAQDVRWLCYLMLIIGCVCECGSPYFFVEVHNREIPDFLVDTVNFKEFYKPARYVCIDEQNATLRETEVLALNYANLSNTSLQKKDSRTKYF